jgi:flagellar motor protein MotB
MLQANPDLRILIEGHTDSSGRASWNQVLSERRADSVLRFLIDNYGIDPGHWNRSAMARSVRPTPTKPPRVGKITVVWNWSGSSRKPSGRSEG